MKKIAARLALVGLFVLPVGTLSATFATVASAATMVLEACPECDPVQLYCPGSTCECKYGFMDAGYKCVPPAP